MSIAHYYEVLNVYPVYIIKDYIETLSILESVNDDLRCISILK